MNNKIAIFALGCFWGVQSFFDSVDGVISTEVGYTGGDTSNPTYDDLFDHTESIKIEYNPKIISYLELLEYFVEYKNPTLFAYKVQYKSAIFYNTTEEKQVAENFLNKEQKKYINKIEVEILPQTIFYKAEEYHQKYNEKAGY